MRLGRQGLRDVTDSGQLAEGAQKNHPKQLEKPRDMKVGELDFIAGDYYEDGLRVLGDSVDLV